MKVSRNKLVKLCQIKLIELKNQYEFSLRTGRSYSEEKADVIDLATREIQVQNSSYFRERIRNLLNEINHALKRIKNGTFGICQLTGDPIEDKRLLAVPYARISIKAMQDEAS